MKKLFLIILLPLLFITQSQAQKLEFGVRGSLAFFLPSGDEAILDRLSLLPGGEGGIFAGASLGSLFHARVELIYISKRWEQAQTEPAILTLDNGTNVNGFLEETLRITNGYFSIPLIFEFRPIPAFGIDFGPNFNFLLQSVATGDLNTISDSLGNLANEQLDYNYLTDLAGEGAYVDLAEKAENFYRTFDLGINVGLNFKLGKNVRIDLRTNLGLLDVITDTYQNGTGAILDRNMTITTGLRYYFIGSGSKDKDKD